MGFAYRALDGRRQFIIRGGYGLYIAPIPMRTLLSAFSNMAPFRATFQYNPNAAAQSPDGNQKYLLRNVPEFVAGHELDSSPCSRRSPYARLIDYDGRILMLGVDLTRCTFIHCLEEIAGLGEIWSLGEPRPRTLIRADGTRIDVLASGHKDYKSDNYGRAEAEFLAAGFLRKCTLNGAPVSVLDCAPCARYLVPRFRENPRYFW
jgi:hypothetical protein